MVEKQDVRFIRLQALALKSPMRQGPLINHKQKLILSQPFLFKRVQNLQLKAKWDCFSEIRLKVFTSRPP